MANSVVDIIIFAPLAPIFGVILFWFIQLLFIESQKYLLSSIRDKHEPLCRFTNFLGIFFQTICHAMGYTVTKSGISSFYISVNYGKVAPKKDKKGIFEWTANMFLFIGPFFIPSSLLLFFIFLITDTNINIAPAVNFTFSENLIAFGSNLFTFSEKFVIFLFSIDLLNPIHLGFFIILIFLGLGIRPSFIGEKTKEKVDMFYDLKNIRYNILHKPLYIVILVLISYIISYISFLLNQNWYVLLFSILGWISISAIISLIISHIIIILIKTLDELTLFWKFISYITIPLSYILLRIIFYFYQNSYANSISLLFMLIITIFVILIILKYKTNKFKTVFDISSLTKKGEEEKNGEKRIIRKRKN
jgi:hypothetical protein